MLHLVGCPYYLYQWCTVKQISDNEIYLLIKYIKSVLWRVAKRLSYIEDEMCLKVKNSDNFFFTFFTVLWRCQTISHTGKFITSVVLLITDLNNTRYYTSSHPYNSGTVYKQWPAKERLLKWIHREVSEDSLLCLKYCHSLKWRVLWIPGKVPLKTG